MTSISGTNYAAYDHPLTWSDMGDLDLNGALKTPYASPTNLMEPMIPRSATEIALRDADSLIDPDFRVPQGLENSVRFWFRIYTEFTTQQVLIFDSRHPELVYDVLDFRSLAKTARGPIAYEIVSKKRIKAAMGAYRRAFTRLTRNPKPSNPSPEEKRIIEVAGKHAHGHSFKLLAHNLRTQSGQRDNIVKGLIAAEAFFPGMEELFRSIGAPVELTRLALVESSFNLHATSRAGAAGVWQFMRAPGRQFLLIDPSGQIDERLSPLKSTLAAGKLLNENYRRFKSWPLAVTSYNHGLRGLKNFRSRKSENFTKIAHLFDPCARKTPLGWAGRNYYSEFLAVVHAEAYRKLFYGEVPASILRPIVFKPAQGGRDAMYFVKASGLSIQEFRFLNPDIRNMKRALPKGFLLALPNDTDDVASLVRTDRRQARLARGSPKIPI